MKYSKVLSIVACLAVWTAAPKGIANAQVPASSYPYVVCSTSVAPFTFTSLGPNQSTEVQAFCNEGDSATGGGVETQTPLRPGTIVTTPENSFHQTTPNSGSLAGITYPDGWQVVVQNTSADPDCWQSPKRQPANCTISFRVCVGCVATTIVAPPSGGCAGSATCGE